MRLTDKSRLALLIETFADAEAGMKARMEAGRAIARRFPPMRRTALYANMLRDADLSDQGRWIVMLMLYYVGNGHAVSGFIAFFNDPKMPDALKLDAILFAFSLNPRLEPALGPDAPRFPLSWLSNGFRQLPPIPERERRAYVLERLNMNLFEERSSS